MTTTMTSLLAPKRSGYTQLYDLVRQEAEVDRPDPVALLRDDPCRIFEPINIVADQWQRDVLTSTAYNIMLLCSRQAGKSQTMAAMALLEALVHRHAEVLIISRTLRQSVELMRKVKELWRGVSGGRVNRRRAFEPVTLGDEVKELEAVAKFQGWDGAALVGEEYSGKVKDKALSMDLPNYARITCLPGNPDGIVGFSAVTLLILDEGSRVPDMLLNVVRPFLAATEQVHGRPGRLVVASTPFGKRGWFWEAWDRTQRTKEAHARGVRDGKAGLTHCPWSDRDAERRLEREAWVCGHSGEPIKLAWQTFRVTADQVPRIKPEFLQDERDAIGHNWYMQEYFCHVPSTEVMLMDGTTKQIKDVVVGDILPWRDGVCNVKAVRDTGVAQTLQVTTEIGTRFTATLNHPMEGPRGRMELDDCPVLSYSPCKTYRGGQQEALARLVAYNLGDGTICKRPGYRMQGSWYSKNRRDMAMLVTDLDRAGLCNYHYERIKGEYKRIADLPKIGFKKAGKTGTEGWQVQANDNVSHTLLQLGCVTGEKVTREFGVPEWVLDGPPTVQTEFVAALFGAEGTTPTPGEGKRVQSTSLTMHKDDEHKGGTFFNQLVCLLHGLGINASWRKYETKSKTKGKWAYTLVVDGKIDNVKRFYDTVGYRYAETKETLSFLWGAYYGAYIYESVERRAKMRRLHDSGMTWKQVGEMFGMTLACAHAIGTKKVARASNSFPVFDEWIAERWNGVALVVGVVDREMQGQQRVMNIEVDSPDHSYLLSDGLGNYNCEFNELTDSVFSQDDVHSMVDSTVKPFKMWCD